MTNILDQVARNKREFRPESAQEFFALQLARKLNDAVSVRSYVELADRFSEDFLLSVYRVAINQGMETSLADRFRVELQRRTRKEQL